jgi:hypothetical protein
MTQTVDITRPLTDDERRKVQAYAESLIASRPRRDRQGAPTDRIDVDGLMGMLAGMGGDKSDKELIREAWDEIVAKYD